MRKKLLLFTLVLLCTYNSIAQNRQVTGAVRDASGTPLQGVNVTVKGTTQGAMTDEEGNFTITVSSDKPTLVFSNIGFATMEQVVEGNTVSIVLQEDATDLGEIVVVGYGTQRKSQLTGAISSVSAKEIQEMPITNLGQALQGRAAGVDVSQSGSKPGSAPKILIRGRRSFRASNDPLYVVDGIPLAGGYEDFNPNDVQSMEVLKDATATAIYGARGANGVIIITTKKGAVRGKTVVTYDNYFGKSQALDKINLFTGPEFAEFVREAYRATGIYRNDAGDIVPTGQSHPEADAKVAVLGSDANVMAGIAANRSTNYQDLILREGFIQNQSIGVQGGNDKTQFYVSGNYFLDKGVTAGLDYSRFSVRANIDHAINSRVKIGLATYLMYSDRNGENINPYSFTITQNPLGAPYNDDGSINFMPTNDALLTNPLAEIVPGAQVDNTKRYRIFSSLYTSVELAKGLTYKLNFGPDFTISRSGRFIGSMTNARKGADPQAANTSRFGFDWTLENIINYNKSFNDKHNLNVTLLHSVQKDRFEQYGINVQGIPDESQQFFNLGNAGSVTGVNSNLIQWTINSYMGRVNYDFNDKYLLTLTIRRDGSSRFGENSKYGNFPGIAAGWNISNEGFMHNLTWIDLLKVRAGWGQVGNQAVSPYQTQALLSRTVYAWDNTAAFGYRPGTIGNPDLRWESSTTTNVGLDFSFFRGRLQGSLELYQTNTNALLLADQLPGSTGFGAVTRNVGETRNRGIEFNFTTININSGSGFRWSTDFQFTKNNEAILELYNGKVDDIGNRWFIGHPLNSYFDYKKVGIWQVHEAEQAKLYYPGDNNNALGAGVGQVKVEDANGDGVINADDRVMLGSDVPDFSAGLTNRFSYKNFDLSFFFFGRYGNTIVSGFHQDNNYLAGRYGQIKVDYWTPDNPNAEFPRPFSTQEFPQYRGTLIYFDGSFLKLRNVNFGYTFKESAAKRVRMESLRIFGSIQQPFIWAKFRSKYNGVDPEAAISSATDNPVTGVNNGITPATRVFTIGINAKF